jgi:DNA (cytosine-5)-methyltransferase 1
VELDPGIAATNRMNLPGVTVIERDIRELTGSEILDFTPGRHIDLLMGCAPCQGFCSLTLRSASEDPRNRLVLEMARLVEETRPDAVLMENVSGLALRGRNLLLE